MSYVNAKMVVDMKSVFLVLTLRALKLVTSLAGSRFVFFFQENNSFL